MLVKPMSGCLSISNRSSYEKSFTMLSIVLPTYNERSNIEQLVYRISQFLDSYIPDRYELLVVDDDSPDLTWQLALDLTEAYPQIRVVRRQEERGLSSAVIRGWQVAKGEILGVIDADLQHPPEVLVKLLQAMEAGADLAVASRHVPGGGVSEWSFIRRSLSRGAQILGLIILPKVVGRVSDPMSGYFMVRRTSITSVDMNPAGYKILLEVIGRGRIQTITEVGYTFQERMSGESKVTWRQYTEYLQHLIRLRSQGRLAKINEKFPLNRFLRFGVVGLSGLLIDYFVFYLLFDQVGLGLTSSNVIAVEAAIINNFLWNDAWTFADFSQQQAGWSARIKRFLKFNLICLAGLLINTLIVNLFYSIFDMNAYIAKLVAISLVTLWNFWVNLKLSWRVTLGTSPPQEK